MKHRAYDKVKWHLEGSRPAPNLAAAFAHFAALMTWMKKHSLLSAYGLKAWDGKPDADFALVDELFTEEGNRLLAKHYDAWLRGVSYTEPAQVSFWEERLKEMRARHSTADSAGTDARDEPPSAPSKTKSDH